MPSPIINEVEPTKMFFMQPFRDLKSVSLNEVLSEAPLQDFRAI